MGRIIQMVRITDDNSLFILAFDGVNELTFRTTRNPQQVQTETITFKGEIVYTNLHHFHIGYLEKFLSETKNTQ